MLVLPGTSAISDFKADLLKNAKERAPQIHAITAIHVHLVQPRDAAAAATLRDTSSQERRVLENLLSYGSVAQSHQSNDAVKQLEAILARGYPQPEQMFCFVLPRPGTISPWSSKATNIVHVCNLE